jgi:hypothetical protein
MLIFSENTGPIGQKIHCISCLCFYETGRTSGTLQTGIFPRISIAQNYKQTKTYGIIKKLSF